MKPRDMISADNTPPSMDLSGGSQGRILEIVSNLPPEALLNVIDVVGDLMRTHARLAEKNSDFLRDIDRMRQTSVDKERLMDKLASLLRGNELNDDHKMRLIDTVCLLALK